jgi:hypothetical protein
MNEAYATQISVKWNVPAYGVGYVTKFEVDTDYLQKFQFENVGGELKELSVLDVFFLFLIFVFMKSSKNHTKAVASKGERLKWTPLKEVKQVPLTASLTKGRLLTSMDLKKVNKAHSSSNNILIP